MCIPATDLTLGRKMLALIVMLGLVLLMAPGTVFAQLSPDDIEALRARGEAEGWTFTVGENPATSHSLDELCGLVIPKDWWKGARFDPCTPDRDLPASFDWRAQGGCTIVKDQASCGSCWAFGTVGPLECNILIKDGVEVDLSEQWLVSCNLDGWGCGGGWWAHNYHEWKTDTCGGTGAVMEADFPYTATDAPCNCPYPHEYLLDNWAYIGDDHSIPPIANIKQAIIDHGPVSVAVYADSVMQGYSGGIFNGCSSGECNHAVVLVGWDDNQGTSGVWFMRNSWGTGWGEDGGYMRIPYGCSSIGYSACYVEYAGSAPTVGFEYPDGRPEMLNPGQATTFRVNVTDDYGMPVPGTGQIHYSLNGGGFVTEAMTQTAPNEYEATLPAADCFDRYNWYVSAEEATEGRQYDPKTAPATTYSSIVATGETVIFDDDFETDQGWTVSDVDDDATTGIWNRANPEGTEAQPEDDHTPSPGTMCWVTDSRAGTSLGSYDVDGGKTTLFSPVIDLSSANDATISYYRWYSNDTGGTPNADIFVVDISDDNGASWTNVETVGPSGTGTHAGWFYHEFLASGFVSLTDQVIMRFIASDEDAGSLVEAAIDDFAISAFECEPAETCDDGIQNQGEDRIDCGGPCPPCECTSDGMCDNGAFCDGTETCDDYGYCQDGTFPCTDPAYPYCDEDQDDCDECVENAHCDDDLFCNGAETCVDGSCYPGSDPCPGQECDEENDVCISTKGDCDEDGDVDLQDFLTFQDCYTGPGGPVDPGCECADFDDDGDVDLADFLEFQTSFTGPG